MALGLAPSVVFTQLFGDLFFPPGVHAYPAYDPRSTAYHEPPAPAYSGWFSPFTGAT